MTEDDQLRLRANGTASAPAASISVRDLSKSFGSQSVLAAISFIVLVCMEIFRKRSQRA